MQTAVESGKRALVVPSAGDALTRRRRNPFQVIVDSLEGRRARVSGLWNHSPVFRRGTIASATMATVAVAIPTVVAIHNEIANLPQSALPVVPTLPDGTRPSLPDTQTSQHIELTAAQEAQAEYAYSSTHGGAFQIGEGATAEAYYIDRTAPGGTLLHVLPQLPEGYRCQVDGTGEAAVIDIYDSSNHIVGTWNPGHAESSDGYIQYVGRGVVITDAQFAADLVTDYNAWLKSVHEPTIDLSSLSIQNGVLQYLNADGSLSTIPFGYGAVNGDGHLLNVELPIHDAASQVLPTDESGNLVDLALPDSSPIQIGPDVTIDSIINTLLPGNGPQ